MIPDVYCWKTVLEAASATGHGFISIAAIIDALLVPTETYGKVLSVFTTPKARFAEQVPAYPVLPLS